MSAAGDVDRLLGERALVIGSLPPGGRDLDLLLREGALAVLGAGLSDAGFVGLGGVMACFRDCSAEVVDLIPAAEWGLAEDELRRLFDEALAVEGYRWLVRPAPHHALLILARRFVGDLRGRLDDKRRRRLAAALEEDPSGWERAAEHAPAWNAVEPLRLLRSAWEGCEPPLPLRARRLVRRPRRGMLVTFSGLDGSGKSSQAEALRDALEALGYDAVVVWTSLVAHPALGLLARPVKWALGLGGRVRGHAAGSPEGDGLAVPAGGPSPTGPAPGPPPAEPSQTLPADVASADPGRELRRRSPLMTSVWTCLVALVNAWWQSRATRPQLLRGRVVICDRWTLDSTVQMRYAYGSERRFGLQARIIRALSPKPGRAYLLDVSAETAVERKPEYSIEQNALRARCYREEHAWLGVHRLDGERPREDLCAEVAEDVWRALAGT